ncbi:MAG: hypothetical protein GTO40_19985, partial [Deltaproteobacteria bacterium]|nr:hypothetical protein [Deltaproteobacteria bacterium]
VITSSAVDFEQYMQARYIKQAAVERQKFKDAGVEYVELRREEQDYYLKGFDR